MQNDPKKYIKLKSGPFFGANQFANAAAVLMLTYDDNKKSHEGSLSISLFPHSHKDFFGFISRAEWQHRYYDESLSAIEEMTFWKVTLPSTLIFSAKDVCTINFTVSFHLYLYLQPREKCFFFRRWVS